MTEAMVIEPAVVVELAQWVRVICEKHGISTRVAPVLLMHLAEKLAQMNDVDLKVSSVRVVSEPVGEA